MQSLSSYEVMGTTQDVLAESCNTIIYKQVRKLRLRVVNNLIHTG